MMSRPLRTSRGENTSAVWGVTTFLLNALEEHKPTHIAWIRDSGTSFGSEAFSEYKATRQKLDDELQPVFNRSVERVDSLLKGLSIRLTELPGYEADDVIGTLATRAASRGLPAVIVSGDKDFYQLIGPGVSLLKPGRGGAAAIEEHWVDETNAAERLGVPPHRVVDYLALVGDSSDNVPGVKGVGEKTARALIEQYGDLETILARAEEISGKRPREALLQHTAEARLSRELVTIRRDVPIQLEPDTLRVLPSDSAGLRRLFTELEFHTLLPKVEAAPAPEPAALRIATTPEHLAEMVRQIRAAGTVTMIAVTPYDDPLRGNLVGVG